jgi:hypothetical protein
MAHNIRSTSEGACPRGSWLRAESLAFSVGVPHLLAQIRGLVRGAGLHLSGRAFEELLG